MQSRGEIPSLAQMMLCLMPSRTGLAFPAAMTPLIHIQTCHQPGPSGPTPEHSFPASHSPVWISRVAHPKCRIQDLVNMTDDSPSPLICLGLSVGSFCLWGSQQLFPIQYCHTGLSSCYRKFILISGHLNTKVVLTGPTIPRAPFFLILKVMLKYS